MSVSQQHPAPPPGVLLARDAPARPSTAGPSSHCVWFVRFEPCDNEHVPVASALASPRDGIPLYFNGNSTSNDILFAARGLERFQHASSIYIRGIERLDLPYTFRLHAAIHPNSTLDGLLSSLRDFGGQPDHIVIHCRDARCSSAEETKKRVEWVGLDYERPYAFDVDILGCNLLWSHYYLRLQCPELETAGLCLRAELEKSNENLTGYGINTYSVLVVKLQKESKTRYTSQARITASVKHLDGTFAHIIEKYPRYKIANTNCQFFCDKSANLLGIHKNLRSQWFDKIQRVFGRSERQIARRHEACTEPPKCPEKLGVRLRRWFSSKFALR